MTIDDYIRGGPERVLHIHEEIAFDILSAMLEEVVIHESRDDRASKPTPPGPPE